jgi:hypothetical protein
MTPKFASGALTAIWLTLVLVTASGCTACGVAGQRCPTTTWTYTQHAPNQWVVTQSYTP